MQTTAIQHLYKPSNDGSSLFYAWLLSMHTRVDIILCSRKSEGELLLVVNRIYDALCRLEKMANFYNPASELSVANRTAFVSPIVLSEELYSMIDLCLEYNSRTLGCFDVTVHSENYNQNTIHSVHLSAGDHSICFSQPGVTINLSGFLKGYALETIRGILNEALIENALINMGNSSILALGNHPVGSGWKINDILLHNECLTTSGNDSPNRRHIVSPQNGKLVEGVKQIAVVTTNGSIGEILSTGLFAADSEQRKVLLAEFSSVLSQFFLMGC
jgi:thiamine biosynthesis lipoprotein